MKRSYTLAQLAHFDRCLYPCDFRDDLIEAGLDSVSANSVSQYIINKRRKFYSVDQNANIVGVIDVYQEFISCKEIIDAIEQVVYDFCNR
jgi:hypothetical protein